ncbi:DUF6265 family protein [Urechidicola croceus]|uniref:DUF6265 domain-containing protein n=1 Tax=Urechidicola croceus TaxID=1850246 RepID=A0A1D8P962_9FLAO|nr:DUF6265 family protein [Urechidicola croceus]AOW21079.1 hypothetical protein LPB138_10480 [Urechidicola croceus]
MKTIKLIVVLIVLTLFNACRKSTNLQQVEFLIGKWKMENKESYESWEKKEDKYSGQSYKFKNGEKVISENIELKIVENQIIYTPTVFDQNNGKGIPFKLNSSDQDLFSFENLEHDFPKKIQYRILSDDELYVSVLGENDKGFSFKLIRQVD